MPAPPFTGTLDLDVLLRMLMQSACAVSGTAAGGVWLLEPDGALALRAADALERADMVARVAPGAWFGGTPAALDAGDAATAPAAAREWIAAERARTLFAVSLAADGVALGSIVMLARDRGVPARDTLARLATMAADAGPALRNALVHTGVRVRAERAEALLAITGMLAATDPHSALDEVARRAASALGADRCAIELWPAETAAAVSPTTPAPGPGSLVVSIARDGATLGRLTVTAHGRDIWDRDTLDLADAIAAQVALAADNARPDHAQRHGASVRRAEELAALLRAARTMMGGLDPKVILEHIVHEAATIAGTPHVRMLLVDEATQTLRMGALTGSPVPDTFSVPVGASYSGRVAVTGEPLFVADTRNDPDNVLAARDREAGIVTYLGLPIKIRDTVLGVLTFHTNAPKRYSAEDLAYFSSFADHAAIALDNARLYADAQRALADLKSVQQTLVQGETLRAIGELAGGAAHHLNNLLTVVVGRVQLLLGSVEDERITRPLQIVERAAKDGAEVVRRLQQFSRMREVTQPQRVDLNGVAGDVLEMTRGHWQDATRARGVEIDVQTRLGVIPAVAGDPAGLREAVTNLILNAVDALPRGGRIVLETALDGAAVTLAVSDTGLGMSEEVLLRAHEPFFTTKGVKATGLGLSVAYGIARRHGGEVAIASAPGSGTTVTLRLPLLAAAESGPAPAPGAAPPAARRLRILLVDDEREVREALAEMLAAHGHTVLTADGGADALARVEAEPGLDVVLTDLVMPGMTGWDLAAAVKARRPHLAVGVITGWGEVATTDQDRRRTVDFLIEKPVSIAALNEAVGRVRPR